MPELQGRCLCGQFSYESNAAPLATMICHCKNCQRQSGAAFSVNVVVPADAVTTKGELKVFHDKADSGNTVDREFCATCGTPIFSRLSANPGIAIIKAGTLDDTSGLAPGGEVWCDSAQSWVKPMVEGARFPRIRAEAARMTDHVTGKTIVITGAGGGFGRLIALKAAARGANVVCGDINEEGLSETVQLVTNAGGTASAQKTDVTDLAAMKALVGHAVDSHGAIDVMINNAGIMPLAFFSDHEAATSAWSKCIDINIKGVMHGIIAAYDPMIAQGRGHVINISSIYGNHPVLGAAVYGATKSAVNFLSESLRVEAAGKIKVTIVKPTGVPGTGSAQA